MVNCLAFTICFFGSVKDVYIFTKLLLNKEMDDSGNRQ